MYFAMWHWLCYVPGHVATLCTWLCGCVMYLAIWLHNVLAMLLCYVPGYVAVMYLAMWLHYVLGYVVVLCT